MKSQSIFITPSNVRYLATFIGNATIDSRSIRFGSGKIYEKLLQVPIAAAGELDAHASIRVTHYKYRLLCCQNNRASRKCVRNKIITMMGVLYKLLQSPFNLYAPVSITLRWCPMISQGLKLWVSCIW